MEKQKTKELTINDIKRMPENNDLSASTMSYALKLVFGAFFLFILLAHGTLLAQQRSFSINIPQLRVSENNEGTHVTWTTQREVNSSYFLIETSDDSLHFTTFKRIAASGSNLFCNRYEDVENTVLLAQFVRIVLVDMNGVSYYSTVARIPGRASLATN